MADRARRRRIGRLAALTALALLAGCGGKREGVDLLLTAPRLFDGERMLRNGAVAIRGGEIVAAGARGDVDVTAERTIALEDATLLPGLIDLHTHQLGFGQVRSAVTTVRDLGTDDRNLPLSGGPEGVRVLASGPLITAPGGYPIPIHGRSVAHVVRTPDGARRYVRSLAQRGAAAIKVSLQIGFPMVTFGVLRAIVAEAHAHGLRVTAHVGEGRGARLALRARVDELAHMPCGHEPELMRDLARAGVEIVGTLHVVRSVAGCTEVVDNGREYVRAGGTLLYGSDYGVRGIPAGAVVQELRLLAETGLGAAGALRAATSEAAELLPVDGLGRLARGSPADLVAVRGNPLHDLGALADPVLVVAGGTIRVGG